VPVDAPLWSPSDLDQLTGPIALYPDPLVAQILPAATYPLDVVSAGQWLRTNPTAPPEAIDAQSWDPSVKAVAHYPTVLEKMADNVDWTQQLGEAYLNQPSDVMDSIQRLREEAQSDGALVTTPQQQVLVDGGTISIIPAQPEVIYVPEYDPAVVYVRRPEPIHDGIRFGNGFHIGAWLDKDTDWHHRWVSSGAHWDRDHRPDQHEHEAVARRPEPTGPRWTRNPQKPVVVHTERRDSDEHRGYAPPKATPASPPRGFGDYKPRQDAEHEEDRGRQSLHQPPAPKPKAKPAPQEKKSEPAHQPAPAKKAAPARPAAPAPRAEPAHQDNRQQQQGQHGGNDHH
jgi:hypothetical protein